MMNSIMFRLYIGVGSILPFTANAQPSREPMYSHPMWEGGWHGWFPGPLMMIVFIAIAVVLVVLVARWLGASRDRATGHTASTNPALDILRERFARGEIDRSAYEERRDVLTH